MPISTDKTQSIMSKFSTTSTLDETAREILFSSFKMFGLPLRGYLDGIGVTA